MNELIGIIGIALVFGVLAYGAYVVSKPHKFKI